MQLYKLQFIISLFEGGILFTGSCYSFTILMVTNIEKFFDNAESTRSMKVKKPKQNPGRNDLKDTPPLVR
jgi:hypothetical protein